MFVHARVETAADWVAVEGAWHNFVSHYKSDAPVHEMDANAAERQLQAIDELEEHVENLAQHALLREQVWRAKLKL